MKAGIAQQEAQGSCEVKQFPGFTRSENLGDVLRDIARHVDENPEEYRKMIVMTAGDDDDSPRLWTRGLSDIEIKGYAALLQNYISRDNLES